ncbi:zinc ribbon domain-containing protein [Haloferacaceae archaeon DSL9]
MENATDDSTDRGCPKCGRTETEVDDISTTGLSKFFDIKNRRFRVVSCTNCGHAELYKDGSTSRAARRATWSISSSADPPTR